MIGRAPQEAAVKLGPGGQRLAPRDQLGVALRHLPGAVHAATGPGLEGHPLDVGRVRLEVIEGGGRAAGGSEGRVIGHPLDQRTVEIDLPVLVERA